MNILALMSGSSLDGLDIGLIEISEQKWNIIQAKTVPYSDSWLEKLQNCHLLSGYELLKLNALYGQLVSSIIMDFNQETRRIPEYISFHGHTVFHDTENHFSFQLGDPGTISALTNISVISDFRTADMSLSGQGAPLMSILDYYFFNDYFACLNLGGICNISSQSNQSFVSFDIGPCNQLLNRIARHIGKAFDDNGTLASKGKLIKQYDDFLQADPYLQEELPKSLSNQHVKNYYLDKIPFDKFEIEDIAYTANYSIACSIYDAILKIWKRSTVPSKTKLLITGGGAFNGFLLNLIQEKLNHLDIKVVVPDKNIVEYKELLLIALLAFLRINSKPNVLANFSGASRNSCTGGIYKS